ncbi:MAG: ribosome biogenesis GTPase Der, partial [Gammaproteobacteria bacterium]
PLVRGRRIKLKYVHLGGTKPPRLIVYGNQCDQVPDHYQRYLVKCFRNGLNLKGIPMQLEFNTSKNPYAGRKNKMTPRQERRRKRLLRHVKKGK